MMGLIWILHVIDQCLIFLTLSISYPRTVYFVLERCKWLFLDCYMAVLILGTAVVILLKKGGPERLAFALCST